MGKTKKKNKSDRTCPTGLKSVRETEADAEEHCSAESDPQSNRILAAIEKLQSASVEDRECGAEVVALVASRKEALEELMRQNVVRIAAPLLMDKSLVVRHSVAGALRNLTVFGGHPVCDIFVQQDVMTPLSHLFKKFYHTWCPAVATEGKIDSKTEIFIEATHLLLNLCESSEKAVSVFNGENLLPILLPCLNVEVYGTKVATATSQCLHVVTADNSELWSGTSPDGCKELLTTLLSISGEEPHGQHLKVLAAGIYLNVHGSKVIGCPSVETFQVLQVLGKCLDVNLSDLLRNFLEDAKRTTNGRKRDEEPQETKEEKPSSKDDLLLLLSAKQTALELLTNVCCNDEGVDDWETLSSSDTSDDMIQLPMEEDIPNQSNMLCMPCEVQEVLNKLNVVQRVEEHVFISEAVLAQLAASPKLENIIRKVENVVCRALLCLHNLATGMTLDASNGKHLQELWLNLAKLAIAAASENRGELLEASTSCLRAAVQRLAETDSSACVAASLTLVDLTALYKISEKCSDSKVRVNVLHVAATLGFLLGKSYTPQNDALIANIGQFLLELGMKDAELLVNAEAADALMDLFAEDHLDPVARRIALVQNSRHLLATLKSKLSHQRKVPGEHLSIVGTIKTNLARFIKYKNQQQQSSNGNS